MLSKQMSPFIKFQTNKFDKNILTVQLPNTFYLDRIMSKYSFPVLIDLFKNYDSPSKEMTESYACFHNLKRHTFVRDENWLHIGDGSRATTAAVFSLYSASNNIAIDPLIREDILNEWIQKWNIKRLIIKKDNFENVDVPFDNYSIACVHAHVSLEEIDKKFPDWTYLYSNACCYPQDQTFSIQYMLDNNIELIENRIDMSILSDDREIFIYKKKRKRS